MIPWMNLYRVSDRDNEWCCFVFDTSANRAKMHAAEVLGMDYIDMRCKVLKRDINVPEPMVVDSEDDEGYAMVLRCGYRYDAAEI